MRTPRSFVIEEADLTVVWWQSRFQYGRSAEDIEGLPQGQYDPSPTVWRHFPDAALLSWTETFRMRLDRSVRRAA